MRSAGVLAVCKAAPFAFAFGLAFAFPLALGAALELCITLTRASSEGCVEVEGPLVKARQPPPSVALIEVEDPSIESMVAAVVVTAADAVMLTPTFSRSKYFAPVVTQKRVEDASSGASGSATPSPRLITDSIFVLSR